MQKKNAIKNVPIRTCIACGKKGSKYEMIRLIYTPEGNLEVDCKGKKKGRGANICESVGCLKTAWKKGIIAKSLKIKRAISNTEFDRLKENFEECISERNFRQGKKRVVLRINKIDLK